MSAPGRQDDAKEGLTVYYDGSCPLCRAEIGHYRRIADAQRVAFCDISDPQTAPGPDLSRENAMARFHVRQADGTLVSGAAGFVALWATLPRWRVLALIARLPGVVPLLELAYRGFLPLRPYLARLAGRLSAVRRMPRASP